MSLFTKISTFARYALMYLLIILIPTALVLASLAFTGSALRQELIDSNTAAVRQIHTTLDNTFQELEKTIRTISGIPELSRYQLMTDPSGSTASIADIVHSHSCLSDLILYVRGSDRFCTGFGCFRQEELANQFYIKELIKTGYDVSGLLELIQNADRVAYWPGIAQTQSNYLCIVTPVYNFFQSEGTDTNRTAALLVSQTHIRELFLSSQTESDEGMLLLAPDCQILSKLTNRSTDRYAAGIREYIKNHSDSFSEGFATLPDSDILIFLSRSEETGLSYVRFLSKKAAYSSLYTQQTFSIVFLVLILIVGILPVIRAARRNQQPVLVLKDWIRSAGHSEERVQSELAQFQSVLDDRFRPTAALTAAVDASRQSLTDHVLSELISGSFQTGEELQNACAQIGIHLDKPYFAACSLLVEEDASGAETVSFPRIFDILQKQMPECYRLYAKDLLSAGRLVLVLCSDSNDMKLFQNVMQECIHTLLENGQLTVSIGMGYFYEGFENVCRSYQDSVRALDYRLLYGKSCLITPDIYNSSSPQASSGSPSYDLILLDSALACGNSELAMTVLRRLRDTVKLKSFGLAPAQSLCYDIISVLQKNRGASGDDAASLPQILDPADPGSHHGIDSFFASVMELVRTSTDSQSSPEPSNPDSTGAQLKEYIDTHCLSYDFQIKNIAEHFSISPQYMRRLFKSHTGMSISEYVSGKRLEKAMHLLAQTDKSLQEIVGEIGNSDISGFVRFFKQKTGLTPGQYRKSNQQE